MFLYGKERSNDGKVLKVRRYIASGITMVEDLLEICARCGKMPRSIDFDIGTGEFRCTRCGNSELMVVSSSDYERVVAELEDKFTRQAIKRRAPDPGYAEPEMPELHHPATAAPKPARKVSKPKPKKKAPKARTTKKARAKKAAPKKKAKKAALKKKAKKTTKKVARKAKKTTKKKTVRKKAAPKKKSKSKSAKKKRKR